MIMYNTHLTRHTLCGLSFIALTLYKISAASLSTQMPQLLEECLPPPQLPHERAFFLFKLFIARIIQATFLLFANISNGTAGRIVHIALVSCLASCIQPPIHTDLPYECDT